MLSSAKSSNAPRALHLESYLLLHLKSPFLVDKKQDPFVILCLCSRLNIAGAVHSFPESCGLWGHGVHWVRMRVVSVTQECHGTARPEGEVGSDSKFTACKTNLGFVTSGFFFSHTTENRT